MIKEKFTIKIEGNEEKHRCKMKGSCKPEILLTSLTQALVGTAIHFEITKQELINAVKKSYELTMKSGDNE